MGVPVVTTRVVIARVPALVPGHHFVSMFTEDRARPCGNVKEGPSSVSTSVVREEYSSRHPMGSGGAQRRWAAPLGVGDAGVARQAVVRTTKSVSQMRIVSTPGSAAPAHHSRSTRARPHY